MKLKLLDTLPKLESAAGEWTALHRVSPLSTPFESPEWLIPWTRHIFRGGRIWVLAFRQDGKLVGLAPLFCWGAEERTVSFLGAGISDYGDLLSAPGFEAPCKKALFEFLSLHRDEWERIDLREIVASSPLVDESSEPCSLCPVLDLATYPASMNAKHCTDLRRAQNKLKRQDVVTMSLASTADLTTHVDSFFTLYEARWGVLDESLKAFHREASQAFLQAGLLRLGLLSLGARPAAAIYAFTAGSTLYCYLSGYEPALSKLSPGAVLLGWMIDRAIAEGLHFVDFLRNTESYKYLWGARDRPNFRLTLTRDQMPALKTSASMKTESGVMSMPSG